MDVPDILNAINAVLWVVSNVLLAYSAIMLVLFLIAYIAIFDPKATTGGKLIFRFMISLVGVISLSFIGIFIDPVPGRDWWSFPVGEVEWWRPVLRVLIYGFTAFSISALIKLLVYRKWFPQKLKKASDINLVQPRHTSEIPVIKKAFIPTKAHAPKGGAGDSGASRK